MDTPLTANATPAEERWRAYKIFDSYSRYSRVAFVGRCLGEERYERNPKGILCALYQDQDGGLYLCIHTVEEFRRWQPDHRTVRCWRMLGSAWVTSREEILAQWLDLCKRTGDDNPIIPRFLDVPVPEIEDQHMETGYDS